MASGAHRNGVPRAGGGGGAGRPFAGANSRSSSYKSRPSQPSGSALRRNSTGSFATAGDDGVPGRVRVAVRLRPRNAEEMVADADFADCVELQPESKRLKLRKNNWDSDTYEFDEILSEFASQKRVYEVVAKPVVESVLDGYNGTVMAYGQTGTGKTFTVGHLGDDDTASRGIMVRAMEDILADIAPETDSVAVSYLQLYMETIQDLLDPPNDNISIVEDHKTGDVSLPGATLLEIRDQQSFLELLSIGENHRIAANTKLNTESSRSHAILMSKLVLVDLAGSERVHKSGSEGHMLEEAKSINLSLSALGKCINALAENSSHVPVRDSKLTRLLKDSFGGTARTSLIVTIGPSPRHRGETASTIQFGQRAMKVENMLKIKEEFDYKSLSRKLEVQVDKLIAENERQLKAYDDELERINQEAQNRIAEVERNFAEALEKERLKCQMEYMESVKTLEEKMLANQRKHDSDGINNNKCNSEVIINLQDQGASSSDEVAEVRKSLQNEIRQRKAAEEEVSKLKARLGQIMQSEAGGDGEVLRMHNILDDEAQKKKKLEEEVIILRSQLLQLSFEADQVLRAGYYLFSIIIKSLLSLNF
ncbi:Kinesin-like protein KIN-UB [Linum perenne]